MANSSERQRFLDREAVLKQRQKYRAFRRIQDVLLSAAGLLILWPFMLLTALMIIWDSPGSSPLFVQDRVGKDGRIFRFYKFRTMVPGAENQQPHLLALNEADGPVFKLREDPRITRVGRFLRRSSIDELPQLVNVLKGDMRIVGPRPPLPQEVEQYNSYQLQRLYVTPGLTCLWQIQPQRNQLSFGEWMELDLKYIASGTLLTDWQIILKTFGAVVQMNGI